MQWQTVRCRSDPVSKLIFLGIDGMDPVITEEMLGAGLLPNLKAVAALGSYSRLATMNPPQSPVVWASIATGKIPSDHGIYDFIHRDHATYRPFLSLHRQVGGKYVNPVKGDTYWERLAARGVPATLLKWPMEFPPRPFNGRLLAGLGVPDIRGMLGRYTVYTTSPETIFPDCKGRVVHVSPSAGRFRSEISGPFTASLSGRKETMLPFTVEYGDSMATLAIGRQVVELRTGAWSPWVSFRFDVGFFRTVTAIGRFLLQETEPGLRLYLTPLQVGCDSQEMPIATPAGYATELRDAVGHYATLGMAEDTAALNDGALNDGEFIELCDLVMQEREQLFMFELNRFKSGLLSCVFDTTDRIQHMFWRMRDPGHPLHDPTLMERHGDVIGRYYRWVDRIVGTVRELHPDATIMICSDHGFTSYSRSLHLNRWLVDAGYMVLNEGIPACELMYEAVDWSKTRAYACGFSSIFLNCIGREKHGVVHPDEADGLKREISSELLQLSESGKPVICRMHDTTTLYSKSVSPDEMPDLLTGFNHGYRASWQTAVGGVPAGPVLEDNLRKWSGDHCCESSLVPGIYFTSQRGKIPDSVTDLASLLLSELQ